MFDSDVYERTGPSSMTRGAFFFVIGIILTYGFAATFVVSTMTAEWTPSIWTVLLVGLGFPILGIFMSTSDNALISFAGFNLVVIPFGAILGPTFQFYELAEPGSVAHAASLTACVTGIMTVSGLLFLNFYRSIGGALFGALLALLGVLVLAMFIPALMEFSFISYAAAGLFALYIGYDMWRASVIPATLDNAVDVSVSLYLDIINLLLWILKIQGGNSD